MSTIAESGIRFRTFSRESMQQVQSLFTRGSGYVQQKCMLLNKTLRGRKSGDPNSSSSTSQQMDSSKGISNARS